MIWTQSTSTRFPPPFPPSLVGTAGEYSTLASITTTTKSPTYRFCPDHYLNDIHQIFTGALTFLSCSHGKSPTSADRGRELDVEAVNKVVGLLGTSEIFTREFQEALRAFPALVKEGTKALKKLNLLLDAQLQAKNLPTP